MIKLGSRVKDIYTGFEGTATGRTEWLYGCTRIAIEPTELHEGKPIESVWFDEQRVVEVEAQAPIVSPTNSATSGGPQKDPRR